MSIIMPLALAVTIYKVEPHTHCTSGIIMRAGHMSIAIAVRRDAPPVTHNNKLRNKCIKF
jgi:hypothetical protein